MKVGRVVFALALLSAACGGREAKPRITIKGSDTMVILGQRFAEEYMKRNPGIVIQVNGGGSGTGIAALINGTVDLAQASRPMKEKEKADVKAKRGVDVHETRVALDALAVFVNEQNPVTNLTVEQLAEIYKTAPAPWVLYGRDNSSGTYEYFKEHVLRGADFNARTQALAGTAAVISAVAKDKNGIGYGGIAYAQGVRAIAINGVEPTDANVRNGTYPIRRYLYFYSVSTASPELQQYIQWCTSPEGQAVVKNVGYFPL